MIEITQIQIIRKVFDKIKISFKEQDIFTKKKRK